MDTELFMECDEEELEPWQQVDDNVEEDDVEYDNYCEPVEDSPSPPPACDSPPPITPPTASPVIQMVCSSVKPPPSPSPPPPPPPPAAPPPSIITSSSSSSPAPAPPLVAQAPPLILTQTAGGTFLLPAATGTRHASPILLTTQGFPVQTVMNRGAPLVLNLQSGQTVQPLTLIQTPSLGQLVRPSVGVSPVLPQGQVVQARPGSAPGSALTAMQLPTTLTLRTSTPGPEATEDHEVSTESHRRKASIGQPDENSDDASETDCSDPDSESRLQTERSQSNGEAEMREEEAQCSSATPSVGGQKGGTPWVSGSPSSRGPWWSWESHGPGPDHEWRHSDWKPKTIPFTASPGPINAAAALDSYHPVHYVELFLSEELLQGIVEQTNRHAEQCLQTASAGPPQSRIHAWTPVTVPELKTFLGLHFLTGVIRKPSLKMYWSTDELFATPYFRRSMSHHRFQLILKFLHFSDHAAFDHTDRLHMVRPVLDYVVSKFRELYQPNADICIDEDLPQSNGRPAFDSYSPQRPAEYGIKSYILCDSETGYCFNVKPYRGEPATLEVTVVSLLDRLAGHGYRLYMDNSCVALCDRLLDLDTHVCGTLRENSKEPPVIQDISSSDLGMGETIMCHNERVMVLAWRDQKVVKMVTSLHQNHMESVEEWQRCQKDQGPQQTPVCVVDHNRSMKGVDRLDQNLLYHPFIRKSDSWSKKYVTYLFELCLFNAFIIYRARKPQADCTSFLSFIGSVVKSWTQAGGEGGGGRVAGGEVGGEAGRGAGGEVGAGGEAGSVRPKVARAPPRAPYMMDPQCRLDVNFSGHEIMSFPPTPTRRLPSRRCRVCSRRGQRRETRYFCKACNVPLHVGECFTSYHTKACYEEKV